MCRENNLKLAGITELKNTNDKTTYCGMRQKISNIFSVSVFLLSYTYSIF